MHEPRVDARDIRTPRAYAITARQPVPGVALLTLEGEFDLAAVPAVRARVGAAAAARVRAVVLDLAEVPFLDSSALRELLRADARLRDAGIGLVLAAPQPAVLRLLELTRTTEVLTLAASVEQALERVAA